MIKLLISLISVLVLVFLETFLGTFSVLSITFVLSLLVYRRVPLWIYICIFVPFSIAMDVYNHILIGGTLIVIVSLTVLFDWLKKTVPFEDIRIKIPFLLVTLFIFHIIMSGLIHASDGSSWGSFFTWNLITTSLFASVLELIIYLLIEGVIVFFGGSHDNSLLKVRKS